MARLFGLLSLLALLFVARLSSAEELDRTTPRRAYVGFMAAARDGDLDRAAKFLDLHALPKAKQATDGPELARTLAYVLEHHVPSAEATLSDDPKEPLETLSIGTLVVDEDPIAIELTRVRATDGTARFVFSKSTVAAIPELERAYGPNSLEDRLPRALQSPYVLGLAPWQWIGLALSILVAIVAGRALVGVSRIGVRRFFKKSKNRSVDQVASAGRAPATTFFAVLTFRLVSPVLKLTLTANSVVSVTTTLALIMSVAWLSIRVLAVITTWLEQREESRSTLEARALRTQLSMLRRIAQIVIGIIAVATALLQFDVVRSVGQSLLASAGIAGIVLGFAAQKSIGALIAGIQISIAQPLRLGDTVVIEGQQGVVEEIHLTYLVVRLADDRRLVSPLSRFLEQSFENWTRIGSESKGAVLFRTDFSVPLDAFRKELAAVCEASPFWDKRVATIRVIDSDASSLTLRAFVSAKNPDDLWELRCLVREKLNHFLVELEGGRYLPRSRGQVVT